MPMRAVALVLASAVAVESFGVTMPGHTLCQDKPMRVQDRWGSCERYETQKWCSKSRSNNHKGPNWVQSWGAISQQ